MTDLFSELMQLKNRQARKDLMADLQTAQSKTIEIMKIVRESMVSKQ